MKISLIVAMGQNRAIGKDNQLLSGMPNDRKYFKSITMGHPIIMGRKTYESIGKALPGRQNIVITRRPDYHAEGAEVCCSPQEALARCHGEEVFIIGGQAIYEEFIGQADTLYITLAHQDFEADTFFPEYDPDRFVETQRRDANDPIRHSFITLNRTR